MIKLFDFRENDYTGNGLAILHPSKCEISETGGGPYELTMELPMDEGGTWKLVQNGFRVQAPVPGGVTELAISGDDVDIYRISSSYRVPVRSQAREETRVRYQQWAAGLEYYIGDKVSYQAQNYECIRDVPEIEADNPPDWAGDFWKEIPVWTAGGPVIAYASDGSEVYLVETYNAYWLKVQTPLGVEGYIRSNVATYVRTIRAEEIKPRVIETQLFNIYQTTISSDKRLLTVKAEHVSYELAGNLIGDCNIVNQSPVVALARIREALMLPTYSTMATDLTDEDGTITGDYTGKNGIQALLDPDIGIVPQFNARLLRDNWDFLIYRNREPKTANVRLRYGENLVGVTWKRDISGAITRVMPTATDADDSTLYLTDDETPWVDSIHIDDYPAIIMETMRVDGKVGGDDGNNGTWTKNTLRDHMRELAERRFTEDKADREKMTLQVEFALLGDTEEYRQYKGLERMNPYELVPVYNPYIGLDDSVQLTEYTWDAIHKRYTRVTLSTEYRYTERSVAGFQIREGAVSFSKLSAEAIKRLKA